MTTRDDKRALRRRLLAARAALDPEVRARASAAATAHLLASDLWPPAGRVALFAAFGDEIDPAALDDGRAVYPRVADGELAFHVARPAELLPQPPWQIREPSPGAPRAEDLRLFVVPGVAFTRAGDRLGYGRGYYDRALARAMAADPAVRAVGLGFEAQIVDALPLEPHDIGLDAIVTEAGVFRA